MARPRKGIDLELVEKLAVMHCTNTEIASVVGCDVTLLSKPRYIDAIQRGKDRGKMTLRRKQYEMAMNGNCVMLIWLGKQILGQMERTHIAIEKIPDDIFMAEAQRRLDGPDKQKSS